jgi:hypothetical protein
MMGFLWVAVLLVVALWVTRLTILAAKNDRVHASDVMRALFGEAETRRWLGAIALALLLHVAWIVFYVWYLHLDEKGFLLGGCYDPDDPSSYGGWLSSQTGPCPPDRPYASAVACGMPLLGLIVGVVVPAIVFKLPFEDTGNLAAWAIFSVAMLVVAAVLVLIVF